MSTHRPHPGRDPVDAILFDHCDRCDEHAARPLDGLDDATLLALWRRMARVEVAGTDYYRTLNEARVGRFLRESASAYRRIAAATTRETSQ